MSARGRLPRWMKFLCLRRKKAGLRRPNVSNEWPHVCSSSGEGQSKSPTKLKTPAKKLRTNMTNHACYTCLREFGKIQIGAHRKQKGIITVLHAVKVDTIHLICGVFPGSVRGLRGALPIPASQCYCELPPNASRTQDAATPPPLAVNLPSSRSHNFRFQRYQMERQHSAANCSGKSRTFNHIVKTKRSQRIRLFFHGVA